MDKECLNESNVQTVIKTVLFTLDHVTSLKKKKILEAKHKRNVTFLEARKIVGSYMGENAYASVAGRADPINQDNKYRVMVEKLIQLEPND